MPAIGVVLWASASLALAPSAFADTGHDSGHDSGHSSGHDEGAPHVEPAPGAIGPVSNAGDGANYFVNHLETGHLSQPLFGFGPTIADPPGWLNNHFLPIIGETAGRATGTSDGGAHHEEHRKDGKDGDHSGGYSGDHHGG